MAVVSHVKGTTTDPVYKSMELLPLGPVVMMDTPGMDDEGELGSLRVKKSRQVALNKMYPYFLHLMRNVRPMDVTVKSGNRKRKPGHFLTQKTEWHMLGFPVERPFELLDNLRSCLRVKICVKHCSDIQTQCIHKSCV